MKKIIVCSLLSVMSVSMWAAAPEFRSDHHMQSLTQRNDELHRENRNLQILLERAQQEAATLHRQLSMQASELHRITMDGEIAHAHLQQYIQENASLKHENGRILQELRALHDRVNALIPSHEKQVAEYERQVRESQEKADIFKRACQLWQSRLKDYHSMQEFMGTHPAARRLYLEFKQNKEEERARASSELTDSIPSTDVSATPVEDDVDQASRDAFGMMHAQFDGNEEGAGQFEDDVDESTAMNVFNEVFEGEE